MFVSADTMALLTDLGVSGDGLVRLFRALEADAQAMAPIKSSGAARQARYRARKAEGVTSDVTRDVTDVTEKVSSSLSPTPPITTSSKTSEPGGSSRQRARASKRVPAEWLPNSSVAHVAQTEGFSPGELERALSMFRDHSFATAHTDWDAAARNWLRRAAKDRPRERPDPRQAKHLATQGNNDAAYAGSQAAARMRAGHG